jgi:chloride channel 2
MFSTPGSSQRVFRNAVSVARHHVSQASGRFSEFKHQVASDATSNVHSAVHYNILDVYSNGPSDMDGHLELAEQQEQPVAAAARQTLLGRLRQRLAAVLAAPQSWLFLILLGVLASVIAVAVDAPVAELLALRSAALASMPEGAGYFVWVLWAVAGTLVAGVVSHRVPLTEGSGIPQVKSILGGSHLAHFLDLRVGAFKWLGLVAAQAAGLSVGREGPFVHLAACVAAALWRLPYFRGSFARSESMRRQLLAAAIAAGVTAVFGVPIGATLFSIEVTATYLLVSNFWRSLIGAVVCRFAFDIITWLRNDTAFHPTAFPVRAELSGEIAAVVVLGVICGGLGAVFVFAVNRCRIARKLVMTSSRRRYVLLAGVAACVATLTYLTPYLRTSDRDALNAMFSQPDAETGADPLAAWAAGSPGGVLLPLAVYGCIKFVVTVTSISLPIACGLFTPVVALGACVGRLYGQILAAAFPSAGLIPGMYAVVGASALVSGVTHTVSTALIVFELTGQMSQSVLLATLVAYSVSQIASIGVYDLLLILAGLPYLPRAAPASQYRELTARDVMHAADDVRLLALDTATYAQAVELLKAPLIISRNDRAAASSGGGGGALGSTSAAAFAHVAAEFAVVDSLETMVLVGTVSRAALEDACRAMKDYTAAVVANGGVHPLAVAPPSASVSTSASRASSTRSSQVAVAAAPAGTAAAADEAGTGIQYDAPRLVLAPGSAGPLPSPIKAKVGAASALPVSTVSVVMHAPATDGSGPAIARPNSARAIAASAAAARQPTLWRSTAAAINKLLVSDEPSPRERGDSNTYSQMEDEDDDRSRASASPAGTTAGTGIGIGTAAGHSAHAAGFAARRPALGGGLGVRVPAGGSGLPSMARVATAGATWLRTFFSDGHAVFDAQADAAWLSQRMVFTGLPPGVMEDRLHQHQHQQQQQQLQLTRRGSLASTVSVVASLSPETPSRVASPQVPTVADSTGGIPAASGADAVAPGSTVPAPASTMRRSSLASAPSSRPINNNTAAAAAMPWPPPGLAGCRVDPAPFQLSELTPLPKLHYMLAIGLFSEVWVTRDGRLQGVILKDDLSDTSRLQGRYQRVSRPADADDASSTLLQ